MSLDRSNILKKGENYDYIMDWEFEMRYIECVHILVLTTGLPYLPIDLK